MEKPEILRQPVAGAFMRYASQDDARLGCQAD